MLFWKHPRRRYFDYAGATPLSAHAARAMRDAHLVYGNPGAIHAEGAQAARSLEESRVKIAAHLGIKPRELLFTSGLTESNNIAILGTARRIEMEQGTLAGTHWIVSAIEHDSVLECFGEIERRGGDVSFIMPDARGIITPERLTLALRKETVFVSVGWSNGEIGTVQPLAKIARVIRAHERASGTKVIFQSDAGQSPLYLPTLVHSLGVDMLSIGAAKLHGPQGIGALVVMGVAQPASLLFGGKQERGLRAGTEHVALASGFAAAMDECVEMREKESERVRAVRDRLARELQDRIPGLVVNGALSHSLPHLLNISLPEIATEYVVLSLDRAGFAISTKSACREGGERESHVVAALPGEQWRASHTLRISLGRRTSARDTGAFVAALIRILARDSGADAS